MNPALAFALGQMNITKEMMETDEIKPSPAQYSLKPGDKAVIAGTRAKLDSEFEVVEILDSSEYAAEYPDWADRLQRSYMLCHYITFDDPMGQTGWFARVKLIQINDEQYQELKGWCEDEESRPPDGPPDWLKEVYDKFTKTIIGIQTGGSVPEIYQCEACGHEPIGLIMMHHTHGAAAAGVMTLDGEQVFVSMDDGHVDCHLSARLYCGECEWTRDLTEDEVRISTASEFAQMLNGHMD